MGSTLSSGLQHVYHPCVHQAQSTPCHCCSRQRLCPALLHARKPGDARPLYAVLRCRAACRCATRMVRSQLASSHLVNTVKMCEAGAVRLKELIPVAWQVYCESASLDASRLADEAFIEKLRSRVVLAERHILAALDFPIFDARRDFAVPMVWKMAEFYCLEHTAPDLATTPVPAGLNIAKTAVNILLDLYVAGVPVVQHRKICDTDCTRHCPSSSAPMFWQQGRCGWRGTCCAHKGRPIHCTWGCCGMSTPASRTMTSEVLLCCYHIKVCETDQHRCGALLLCALHAAAQGRAT